MFSLPIGRGRLMHPCVGRTPVRPLAPALALALVGCIAQPETPPTPTPSPTVVDDTVMTIASSAFEDGGDIPRGNSCDGEGLSPPLVIAEAPANATTIALIAEDPDVPTPLAPQRVITHWVLWNAPLVDGTVRLPEGGLPGGAVEGEEGWRPPCPPHGSPAHRYVFTAYAVEGAFDLDEGATRAQLEDALDGNVLAEATITGMYARAIVS